MLGFTRLRVAYCLIAVAATSSRGDDQSQADARAIEPRAWYILSQTDTNGLLLGLPQRLGKTLAPSLRQTPMWKGVDDGAAANISIEVQGDAEGEVFVGFFQDPRWWIAEPVQVRRLPGPGQYSIDRLMPGKFYVGAMIGSLPRPAALGVNDSWPAPIALTAGQATTTRVRISDKFRNMPAGQTPQDKHYAGEWDRLDPTRMITLRVGDADGLPVPFAFVTFFERRRDDPTQVNRFHFAGTDEKGYAYLDSIVAQFTVQIQRFDFVPERMQSRCHVVRLPELHRATDRPVITHVWQAFPAGTGTVKGLVHDQHKKPLDQYYLTLTRRNWQPDTDQGDEFAVHLPVTSSDGRFEVGDLPPGVYTVMVRHFDYPTHVSTFDGPRVTLPDAPNGVVETDVEVEAKELLYGVATFEDGLPAYPGSWSVADFSLNIEPDGSFRVPLARAERDGLLKDAGGMVKLRYSNGNVTKFVHIDQLSKDKQNPARVIFVGKRPAIPQRDKPQRAAQKAEGRKPPAIGKIQVNDFEVLDTDGRAVYLADYAGQPVLLNSFATWCGPCQEELPALVELHERIAKRGLVILAVCQDKENEVAEEFARRNALPFRVVVDHDHNATALFRNEEGQLLLPTCVLLDSSHVTVHRSIGFDKEISGELVAAIERAIASDSQVSAKGASQE